MDRGLECLALLIAIALAPTSTDAIMCYTCDHVAHPRDCDRVMECPSGSTCHVTSYTQPDGHTYYKSGCLRTNACPGGAAVLGRRDQVVCNKCCHTPYCNKGLCDTLPATGHGLRCLKCDAVEHPTDCGAVTECAPNEVCRTEMIYSFGERRFNLGCAPLNCQAAPTLISPPCLQCCMEENCNRDICTNVPTTPSTPHPITHAQTTHLTGSTPVPGCHYKGHVYSTNDYWNDGCDLSCFCLSGVTGRYECHASYIDIGADYPDDDETCYQKCPTYSSLPQGCNLVKTPGECCAKPNCHQIETNITTFHGCYVNGTTYQQDDKWRVGCDYDCTCVEASRGYYRCTSLCFSWSLPSVCTYIEPAPGKCCRIPNCPSYMIIQYPPEYQEN